MAVTNLDWSEQSEITPTVDATREFLEIAADFANPLDIVREAISNSYDAQSSIIRIRFEVTQKYGEYILKITIEDDGRGMNNEGLKAFFDLGNSPARVQKEKDKESTLIGEKGHGTKIYFNSERVQVTTAQDGILADAVMERPYALLHEGTIPTVLVKRRQNDGSFKGTRIEILGYNRNRRDLFNHDRLRDHVLWFTKHGSFEKAIDPDSDTTDPVLYLQGVDRVDEEAIPYGHVFPQPSESVDKLFDKYLVQAPDYYARKWVRTGSLPNFPDITFQAVFFVEGDKVKRDYNAMLRRRGVPPKQGSYTVQERYGLWLCKDFIPVQRKNEWFTARGTEYTRLHAFINCQALRLTANRGSVENTAPEILTDLMSIGRDIYNSIIESDEWSEIEYLEQSAAAYLTEAKEKSDYERRVKFAKSRKTPEYKGIVLVEPRQESGVYAILVTLQAIEPGLFPFEIVDYDTHTGIDVVAKVRDNVAIEKAQLRYVELKHTLSANFNHSFRYLHSIVCWKSAILHDEDVEDISGTKRKMIVTPRTKQTDYTRYMLDDPRERASQG